MADFVKDFLDPVETKTDSTPPPAITTTDITAKDVNALSAATVSLRAAILSSTYSRLFNVMRYGATGNGFTNDLPAIQAATAAAQAAGGGTVYFPRPTVCYRTTGEWIVGSKFIEIADVKYAAGGWNPAAQASYNSTADSATQSQVPISIVAEPGTEIWGDFAPAAEKAILWYGIRGNYRASKSALIQGLGFVGQQGYASGAPADLPMSGELPTSVTTTVSGLMLGNARAKVTGCTARAVKRGFVGFNCFWSRVEQCAAYQCVDGFTMIGFNAGCVDGLEVTAAKGYGYVLSGQGINISKINTEGALVDVWIPAADNVNWTQAYLETNDSTATGYSVIWGDSALATTAQVINAKCENLHSSRANGKHMSLFATQLTCTRSRMFVTNGTSYTTIQDVNSQLVLDDCYSAMPLQPAGTYNSRAFLRDGDNVQTNGSLSQTQGDYSHPLKIGTMWLWKDPAYSTLQFKYGSAPTSDQDGQRIGPVPLQQTITGGWGTLTAGSSANYDVDLTGALGASFFHQGDIITVAASNIWLPAGMVLTAQPKSGGHFNLNMLNLTGSSQTQGTFSICFAVFRYI